jgi:hypothetical protein
MTASTDPAAWGQVADLVIRGQADRAVSKATTLGVRAWRTFHLVAGPAIHLRLRGRDAELVAGLQGGCFVDVGPGARYCHTSDEAAGMLASWAGLLEQTEEVDEPTP